MTEQNPAIFLQAGSHPAEDVRRFIGASMGNRPGIVAAGDLAVSQNGTPNMSVNVAGGQAFIAGSQGTYQGLYFVENRGTTNLVISAADATNPRRDLIVARVQDAAYSGATNAWSLAVVTGTPAASPAEPAAPANSLVLAVVAVAAGATSITNANITDRRLTPGLYTGNLGGRAASLGAVIYTESGKRPTSGLFDGLLIYETDTDRLLIYEGSGWVILSEPPQAPAGVLSSGLTSGNGTFSGFYKRDDGWVDFEYTFTFGSTSAVTGDVLWNLPFTAQVNTHASSVQVSFYDNAGTSYLGMSSFTGTATNFWIRALNTGSTYGSPTALSSTIPFTWGSGDIIHVKGRYRMATRTS